MAAARETPAGLDRFALPILSTLAGSDAIAVLKGMSTEQLQTTVSFLDWMSCKTTFAEDEDLLEARRLAKRWLRKSKLDPK